MIGVNTRGNPQRNFQSRDFHQSLSYVSFTMLIIVIFVFHFSFLTPPLPFLTSHIGFLLLCFSSLTLHFLFVTFLIYPFIFLISHFPFLTSCFSFLLLYFSFLTPHFPFLTSRFSFLLLYFLFLVSHFSFLLLFLISYFLSSSQVCGSFI